MWCSEPFPIYQRGAEGVLNPATGEVERSMVACGQCATCIAGRKNDWTGRLTAEALKAKEVYFLTLTYAVEQEEFRYRDVQLMLYRLRKEYGAKGVRIRYFVVGERGNKYGRIHWHALIFASPVQPGGKERLGWEPWNKETNPGQLWRFWPDGWTQIDPCGKDDVLNRIRYTAKYAVKRIGDDLSCRPRFSLKPLLGWEYIREYAEGLAERGLPFRGTYTIPGHLWSKGPRTGQAVKYRLRGAAARHASDAYMDTWEARGMKRAWVSTPFLATYGNAELMRRIAMWPEERNEMQWCRSPMVPMTWEWVADPDHTAVDLQLFGAVRLERVTIGASKEQLATMWAAKRGAEEQQFLAEQRGERDERYERWLREDAARAASG